MVAENFAKEFIAPKDELLKSKKSYSLNKFRDENGVELLYVINYEDGGFLILPADNRVYPILAYSETNSFTTDETALPDGVNVWVQDIKKEIKQVKKENKKQSKEIKFFWDKYLSFSSLKDESDPPPPCEDEFIEVWPLLQTEWEQGVGFNDL